MTVVDGAGCLHRLLCLFTSHLCPSTDGMCYHLSISPDLGRNASLTLRC